MRHVPEALAARIAGGEAQLCHAWTLTRTDGTRLGFTDHDEPLEVDEVACNPATGLTAGAVEGAAGWTPGAATVLGALDDAGLGEADIEAGLYDGAVLECWRLDWSAPTLWARTGRWTVARLLRTGGGFTAELEGPLAALEQVAGRLYGRTCDAALGDARCRAAAPAGAVCDKRFSTCREVFGNAVNFQGFPDLPGDDFLSATPGAGETHDGGSRR